VPRPQRSLARPPKSHPSTPSAEQVEQAALAFSLLSDPTRVRMLWAMRDSEQDVTALTAAARCRQPVASQHLAKLRLAGLVQARREGRRVIYRLRGAHVRALLTEALFHADHQVTGEPTHE
jgi:DNA-binding transcriptional ArsR family regulator